MIFSFDHVFEFILRDLIQYSLIFR